jgi:type IV pilus assembly protein PilP
MLTQKLVTFLLFGLLSGKVLAQSAEYSFDPLSVKRDPFLPPNDLSVAVLPDIQRYELGEMRLMAIMSGMGTPKALVMLPSGKSHIVQKGDTIGKYRGKVDKISSTELSVREQFVDHKGRKKTSLTSLVIAD